ncbi:hypothetical protein I6L37_08060 [Aeromonas sp. FDAARGOS 1407]|uniref:hypothetical protein n=1 Tax=Aeromonas sp. FDAARGOS 1407 TaxID=2778056 RepID=UPI001C2377C2|nr:hypothetical protein [Aeromonas sp. FDAARGOS 1407]QXC35581.1 hypothetical protein I6L37_08060 [Aeromonas sp. FDAARGOS 1407]
MDNECKHCKGAGTCTSGVENNSCLDCSKKSLNFAVFRKKETLESNKGLVCKQCEGSGLFDPKSRRLHSNVKPFIALFVVIYALYIVLDLALKNNGHFNEVLPFVSGLVSTIIAFYFTKGDKNS